MLNAINATGDRVHVVIAIVLLLTIAIIGITAQLALADGWPTIYGGTTGSHTLELRNVID